MTIYILGKEQSSSPYQPVQFNCTKQNEIFDGMRQQHDYQGINTELVPCKSHRWMATKSAVRNGVHITSYPDILSTANSQGSKILNDK